MCVCVCVRAMRGGDKNMEITKKTVNFIKNIERIKVYTRELEERGGATLLYISFKL